MTLEVFMSYATKSKSKSPQESVDTSTDTPAATRRSRRISTAAATGGDKGENGTKTPRRRKSVSKVLKEEEEGDGLISVSVPATATPSARKGRGKAAKTAATPAVSDTPVSTTPTAAANGESTVKKRRKSKASVVAN